MDFFVQGKYLGSAPSPTYNPLTCGDDNIAWFCQTCGEVWGRILVNPSQRHVCLNRACTKHKPHWTGDEAGCLTRKGDNWKLPQLNLTTDTPFAVLLNDFNQLWKIQDDTTCY